MANNKYSYKASGSKAKPIIIAAAAAIAVLGGTLGYLAYNANEENRVAALRYEFNRYYPHTYNPTVTLDAEDDYDSDGLTNDEEKIRKTNVLCADTDGDTITDKDEEKFGTDPFNPDCDSDNINDGIEILAGLDPLSPITDGQTKDADRKFRRVIDFGEGSMTLTGGANIFGATVEQLSLNAVSSNAGAITMPYELYCASGMESATVSFSYSDTLLKASGIDPSDVKIFKFNPYLKNYDDIGGSVDTENKTVSASVEGSGVFVLGADRVIQSSAQSETNQLNIHILIDNSGSMYPKSIQSTSKENDVNFKRLSFASRLVNELQPGSKAAISAFTYEFKNICGFSDNKQVVIDAINQIRYLGAGFDGTSVERALMIGLEDFTADMINDKNVVILLTDGISTSTAGYTVDDITALAKSKNVTIMTISLGDDIDSELLQTIADRTGGKYFPISEANILEGLYSTMIASMQDDIVDDDYDGTPDSYTLFDTGFMADTNGFSFNNFKTKENSTLDFGMTALARDWFKNAVHRSIETDDPDVSYTFEGTTLNTSEPLRKVILQCMQEAWVKPENYLDFSSGNKTLGILVKEENAAREKGWSVVTVPYTGSDTWNNVELLYPDYTKSTMRTKYSENDYQMIRAIVCYDKLRGQGSSFTLNDESDLDKVKKVLGTGTPLITKISWEENGSCYSRYVLLTTLRRDLENPNIFKMKIYDVNSESGSTVIVNRVLKLTKNGEDDFSYSAFWNDKKASLSFCLVSADMLRKSAPPTE